MQVMSDAEKRLLAKLLVLAKGDSMLVHDAITKTSKNGVIQTKELISYIKTKQSSPETF